MPVGDIVSGYTFVPAEKNIDQTKLNAIAGQATIAPAFISGQTPASSTGSGDYFVFLQSTGALAKILTQDLATSIGSSSGMTSAITAVRLRSFNAVGNPNFEVDQRTVGSTITFATPATTWVQDRWQPLKVGVATGVVTAARTTGAITVPGTNFAISTYYQRMTLSTAQATLLAGDIVWLGQTIEGCVSREIGSDVNSLSILARSSVANLSFGVAIRDSSVSRSLVKLCQLGAANTWTLIPLPNLPAFVAGGSWTYGAGVAGYLFSITLASGTTYITPANDVWQTGNYIGAVGQSNFLAQAVNSTLDIGFVQHEPGPLCTTLIDKPFSQNLDECLRYFASSYVYGTKAGTVANPGVKTMIAPISQAAMFGSVQFPKVMAKVPTVTIYNHATGAANSIRDGGAVDHAGATATNIGDAGFGTITFTTATTGPMVCYAHYTSDTGW